MKSVLYRLQRHHKATASTAQRWLIVDLVPSVSIHRPKVGRSLFTAPSRLSIPSAVVQSPQPQEHCGDDLDIPIVCGYYTMLHRNVFVEQNISFTQQMYEFE